MAVTASQAVVVYQLFCIKENREEEAEKTPSTCSANQGNQHFSHQLSVVVVRVRRVFLSAKYFVVARSY